ncbi:hypothetical protein [Pseudaeromonas pectinilytica]
MCRFVFILVAFFCSSMPLLANSDGYNTEIEMKGDVAKLALSSLMIKEQGKTELISTVINECHTIKNRYQNSTGTTENMNAWMIKINSICSDYQTNDQAARTLKVESDLESCSKEINSAISLAMSQGLGDDEIMNKGSAARDKCMQNLGY